MAAHNYLCNSRFWGSDAVFDLCGHPHASGVQTSGHAHTQIKVNRSHFMKEQILEILLCSFYFDKAGVSHFAWYLWLFE